MKIGNEGGDEEKGIDPVKEELDNFYMEYGKEIESDGKYSDRDNEGDKKAFSGFEYESIQLMEAQSDGFVTGFNNLLLKEEETKNEDGEEEEEEERDLENENQNEGGEDNADENDDLLEKVGLIVELAEKRKRFMKKDGNLFDKKNKFWSFPVEENENAEIDSANQPERDFRSKNIFDLKKLQKL